MNSHQDIIERREKAAAQMKLFYEGFAIPNIKLDFPDFTDREIIGVMTGAHSSIDKYHSGYLNELNRIKSSDEPEAILSQYRENWLKLATSSKAHSIREQKRLTDKFSDGINLNSAEKNKLQKIEEGLLLREKIHYTFFKEDGTAKIVNDKDISEFRIRYDDIKGALVKPLEEKNMHGIDILQQTIVQPKAQPKAEPKAQPKAYVENDIKFDNNNNNNFAVDHSLSSSSSKNLKSDSNVKLSVDINALFGNRKPQTVLEEKYSQTQLALSIENWISSLYAITHKILTAPKTLSVEDINKAKAQYDIMQAYISKYDANFKSDFERFSKSWNEAQKHNTKIQTYLEDPKNADKLDVNLRKELGILHTQISESVVYSNKSGSPGLK